MLWSQAHIIAVRKEVLAEANTGMAWARHMVAGGLEPVPVCLVF